MNLISTLNAGLAAAANGWAEIYIRGTSTRATYYSDFEASTSNSSGANIPLDAYGAVEVYVNQLVDVIAKSPDGTVIRSWTDGYSSPNVEVISPAFTGHDYVSGAAAVNEPTTLQAILDLWVTNSGAPDWKVLLNGTSTTLATAIGSLNGLVFNVKSPAYGAVGTGVVNDQTAIQSALADAIAAGGGVVFFPVGTYLVSTAIEWDQRVSMVGIGGGASVITTNSASNAQILKVTTGSTPNVPFLVSGMTFASTQTNSGTQFNATVALNVILEKNWFCSTVSSTGSSVAMSGSGGRVILRDNTFYTNSNSSSLVWGNVNRVVVDSCRFVTTGTSFTGSIVSCGSSDQFVSCLFDMSSLSVATTFYVIEETFSGGLLSVTNCRFANGSVAPTSIIRSVASSATTVVVSNCLTNVGMTYSKSTAGVFTARSRLQLSSGNSGSSATTVPDGFDVWLYEGGAVNLTMPTGFYQGQPLRVLFRDTSGGWTPTFTGATVMPGVTIPAMTAGNGGVVDFVYTDTAGAGAFSWRAVYAVGG